MHIGRYFKLDIYLDWSIGILMGLFSMSFYSSVIKSFPETNSLYAHLLGGSLAILILLSIFAHELGHVLTGRRYGIEFKSIRFFIFGGAATMANQPPTPKSEFFMALAGPIVSLALALVGYTILPFITGGPEAALVNNLSHLNLVLGIFNMLPIFPMDGGRCLRALVWHKTGSFKKGTLLAGRTGKYAGQGLMACGVLMALGVPVPYFGAGVFGGLWIGMIGWMISGWAAREVEYAVTQR